MNRRLTYQYDPYFPSWPYTYYKNEHDEAIGLMEDTYGYPINIDKVWEDREKYMNSRG